MVVRRRTVLAAGALTPLLALAACAADDPDQDETTADLPQLTLGLTYVPNVQFAPFYLAEQKGYFTDAGVDVTLRHHGESEDLFGALRSGTEDLVVAGGDEMMQARSSGVPVVDIATLYTTYPVALIVPADSSLQDPEDLAGHSIGVPGPFGETYFGLLAMLRAADLTEDDVDIQYIGFTQQDALSAGHVDAVMGYTNNDVPQFAAGGTEVRAISLGDVPLVGIGLGTTEDLLAQQPDALTAVIDAVGRAVQDLVADPSAGVDAAAEEMPGTVSEDQRAVMKATMQATVPLYGDLSHPFGLHTGPWEEMSAFLAEMGLTPEPVPAQEAYTDALVESE